MSESDEPPVAEILARRAEGDLLAARELAKSPQIDDLYVGFHVQQAVEKWLKAVLASCRVRFPFTHDIDHLAELIVAEGIELSFDLDAASALTDYAVPLRYGEGVEEDEPLDRDAALQLGETVGAWATALIAESQAEA